MSAYRVRWLSFDGRACPILLQDQNGPCPLIAIVNLLSLRGALTLPPGTETIAIDRAKHLVTVHIANFIAKQFDSNSVTETSRANTLANFDDVSTVMAGIERGLDLNPSMTSVFGFEFTKEVALFDAVESRICHGWLIDPQNTAVMQAVGALHYNELINLCASDTTNETEKERIALVQSWINDNSTQLTVAGLAALHTALKEKELAIFLRNNHYNVIHKRDGELFLLVTDVGLIESCPILAWNKIMDVEGSEQFTTQNFLVPSQKAIEQCMLEQNDPKTANIHTNVVVMPVAQPIAHQQRLAPTAHPPHGVVFAPPPALAHAQPHHSQPQSQQPLTIDYRVHHQPSPHEQSHPQPRTGHLLPQPSSVAVPLPRNNQPHYQRPNYQPAAVPFQSSQQYGQPSYPQYQPPRPAATMAPVTPAHSSAKSDDCTIM